MKIRKKGTCLLLLMMVFSFCACSTPAEKMEKFMAKGKAHSEQGNHVKALLEYRNALAIDPANIEAYYLAGMAELNQGKLQEAYAYFMKTVEKQADHVDANIQIGKLLLGSREFVKAQERVDLALRKEPDNQQALLLQGAILLGERKAAQAKEVLEKLVPRNEKEADVYLLLATAYRQLGDPAATEKVLQKGVANNPNSIGLQIALANLYLEQNQAKKVEAVLKNIITLEPGKAEHTERLAAYYWHEGRKAEAEALVQGLLEKKQANEERWAAVAGFYLSRQELDKGKQLLLDGLQQHKNSFRLRFLLKDVYLAKGEVGKAIATLQECLTLDQKKPDFVVAQRGLAELYLRIGSIDEAERYVADILKKSPNDVDAHLLKASILMIKRDFNQAIAEYRIGLQARPKEITLYPRMAEALVLNRQNNLAIDTLKQGLQVAPDSAELHRAMARLYVLESRPKDAEAQLQKMVDLKPEDLAAKVDLADFYVANDGQAKAMQIYKTVIARAPDNQLGYLRLSNLYAMEKQGNEAVATITASLVAQPNNNALLEHGVQLSLQMGRNGEALALTEQRLRRHPDDVVAYNLQGDVHATGKDFAAAEQDFRKAMELNAEVPETAVRLARILVLEDKAEKAIGETEMLVNSSTATSSQFILLAELYKQTKRNDQSLAVYNRALEKYPENWFILNNLAYYVSEGPNPTDQDLTKAENRAKKAQLLAPGNMAVLDTLGWLSYKMGKMDQARAVLTMALTSNPNNPVFSYHMGMILLKDGKKEEAKSLFEKVVRSPGNFGERDEAEKMLKGLSS